MELFAVRVCDWQGKLGEILLSLCYQPTAEILSVVVIEARQLKSKDINGLSGALWAYT